MLFVAYGLQFSFGVFVNEITTTPAGAGRTPAAVRRLRRPLLVLSSVSGWATDRYGPRRVVAIGAVILGIGWAGFGLSHELWQVYLTLGVVAAVGMSATWVPCNATVVRWFVRRRGTAVGVASAGGATGNLVVPPVAAGLIAVVGWRATIPAMAVVGTVAMLACSRFMVRDPEELGLHPDGDALPPVATATSLADEDSFTAAEARRTGTFWCLFALFALTWIAVFVPFAHLAAFAEDLGESALAASLLLSAIGLGGVAGRLTIGPLSDRVGRRPTLAFLLALQVVAFSGFAAAHGLCDVVPGRRALRRRLRRLDHDPSGPGRRPVRPSRRWRHRRPDLRRCRRDGGDRPVRRSGDLRRHRQLPHLRSSSAGRATSSQCCWSGCCARPGGPSTSCRPELSWPTIRSSTRPTSGTSPVPRASRRGLERLPRPAVQARRRHLASAGHGR